MFYFPDEPGQRLTLSRAERLVLSRALNGVPHGEIVGLSQNRLHQFQGAYSHYIFEFEMGLLVDWHGYSLLNQLREAESLAGEEQAA